MTTTQAPKSARRPLDPKFYATAAQIAVGTLIHTDGGGTLEVISKERRAGGWRIRTRDAYGPTERRCAYADDYVGGYVFELGGQVAAW